MIDRVMVVIVSEKYGVLLDAEDLDKYRIHLWSISSLKRKKPYVRANIYVDGKRKKISLHRFLLGLSNEDVEVDHVNGDTLDNRKQNLRIATKHQNAMNRGKQNNNTSGYKGVFRVTKPSKNPWQAKITVRDKQIYLGVFPTAEAAAHAYDAAAMELHGEFAQLNFKSFEG